MTEATSLIELAERVEAATGPDRLLDANIHWQVRREDFESDQDHTDETYCYARGGWTLNRADRLFLESVGVRQYTASIDAAMSLVPKGLDWGCGHGVDPADHEQMSWAWCGPGEGPYRLAATPALALCAAALKARAAQ